MDEASLTIIRPYRAEDQAALLVLVRELQEHERAVEPLMKPAAEIGTDYIAELQKQIVTHGGEILVAEENGSLLGYAAVMFRIPSEDADEVPYEYAYISDVAVTAHKRGRGLGRRLLKECEKMARAAGAERLRISVLSQNQGAKKLYAASGFSERVTEMEKPLK